MKPTALRRLPRPAAALARFSALALGLAGCASGPDFHRPAMPEVAVHTAIETPMTTVAAPTAHGEAQRLVPGLDVERAWWRTLKSPKLDALIEAAFAENRSLAAARATLRQAQAVHAAQSGSTELPRVDANLGAQRQRFEPFFNHRKPLRETAPADLLTILRGLKIGALRTELVIDEDALEAAIVARYLKDPESSFAPEITAALAIPALGSNPHPTKGLDR